MNFQDRSIVITGAADGIGRALALRFADERPRGVDTAALVAGIDREAFLILPHPDVIDFFAQKASNYEQWPAQRRQSLASIPGHA